MSAGHSRRRAARKARAATARGRRLEEQQTGQAPAHLVPADRLAEEARRLRGQAAGHTQPDAEPS